MGGCVEAVRLAAFDALVCNVDRRLTNFGLLRDSRSGAPIGLAPVFDNGRALFPNVAEDDTRQFALESQLRGPAFGGRTFEELLSRFAGERQLSLLERAHVRGIVGNVLAPGRRVAALDAFLRERAESLASTQIVEQAELISALESAMVLRANTPDDAFHLILTERHRSRSV